MLFVQVVLAVLLAPALAAPSSPGPFDGVNISAKDGSVKATFIPYGATLTNFWTKDKYGKLRDIAIGYDDKTLYAIDGKFGRQYLGPVVGRYANRIKNATFVVDGVTYHVPANEHDGKNSLHGGFNGFDARTWKVDSQKSNEVTFSLVDPSGTEGFPGTVKTKVTYTLNPGGEFKMVLKAVADKKTPILLSGHHFWNFEAYEESQDLIGHFAQIKSSRAIEVDSILIPTGNLLDITKDPYTPLDFRQPKSIGTSLLKAAFCGDGCKGFDNAWIYDNVTKSQPAMSLWSVNSGIRLDVTTNQKALQIYTCNGMENGAIPRKRSQNNKQGAAHYTNYSCFVLEQEGWIGGIQDNTKQWGQDQIYGPGTPNGPEYVWEATHKFSVMRH